MKRTRTLGWIVIVLALLAGVLLGAATARAQFSPVQDHTSGAGCPSNGGSDVTQCAAYQVRADINNHLSGAAAISPSIVSLRFASLPPEADGRLFYCSDCHQTVPCASGGSGAFALGTRGAWACTSPGVTGVTGTAPIVSSGGSTPIISLAMVPVANGGTQCGAPTIFASLPASPVLGETCHVTDAVQCLAGHTLTVGGGSGLHPADCAVTADGAGNWNVSGGANVASILVGVNGTSPIVVTNNSATSGAVTSTVSLSGVTAEQGNGAKVQLSTGATSTNDCVKFDANGNTIDAGAGCGGAPGGAPGAIEYNNSGAFGGVVLTGLVLGNGSLAPTAFGGNSLAAHNFANAISALGVLSGAQPAFTDLSGTATIAQVPAITLQDTTVASTSISTATTLVLPANGHSMQPLTMTAAATITIPQGQWAGQSLNVVVCQNGTGGFPATFAPIAGLTIVGTFPVFTATASACGDFSLQYSTTTNAYLTGSNPGPL